MKKAFNTSIEESVSEAFKAKCKEENIPMNKVLEMFMDLYIEGKFKIEMIMDLKEEE